MKKKFFHVGVVRVEQELAKKTSVTSENRHEDDVVWPLRQMAHKGQSFNTNDTSIHTKKLRARIW